MGLEGSAQYRLLQASDRGSWSVPVIGGLVDIDSRFHDVASAVHLVVGTRGW